MKRREAVSAVVWSLVGLPMWTKGWKLADKLEYLPKDQADLLADIMETILPSTASPGSMSLKIHDFAQRVIFDCMGTDAINLLKNGLEASRKLIFDVNGKSFDKLDTQQKLKVIKMIEVHESTNTFFENIKKLTVWGYTNSEYYLNTYTKYNMAPGFYHGCVPISQS